MILFWYVYTLLVGVLLMLALPWQIRVLLPAHVQRDQQSIPNHYISPENITNLKCAYAEHRSRQATGILAALSSSCDATADEAMEGNECVQRSPTRLGSVRNVTRHSHRHLCHYRD